MTTQTAAHTTATGIGVSITASLGAFIQTALQDIAMWLLVMFTVIIVDLMMACYKVIKVRERKQARGMAISKADTLRLSKGIRDTMAKMATYFAFVVSMVFVANASQIENLEIWGCMLVIFGEALSIIGNWCKAHGYNFNNVRLLNWAFSKASIPDDVVTEQTEEELTQQ